MLLGVNYALQFPSFSFLMLHSHNGIQMHCIVVIFTVVQSRRDIPWYLLVYEVHYSTMCYDVILLDLTPTIILPCIANCYVAWIQIYVSVSGGYGYADTVFI
jgi:hypothetical protein